jgi:hypothetical protein
MPHDDNRVGQSVITDVFHDILMSFSSNSNELSPVSQKPVLASKRRAIGKTPLESFSTIDVTV